MKNIENDNYSTSDLALASVLSIFCPIELVDRSNPHKALFVFKNSKRLKELVDAYWRKEIKLEVQTFFNQLKALKSRLYEEK